MLMLLVVAFVLGMILAVGLITYDEVKAEIDIEADAEDVWKILTDFEKYENWNPFIKQVSGSFQQDEEIKVTIALPFSKTMDFNLKVGDIDEGRSFVWLGTTLEPRVLDGVHTFQLESSGTGKSKLIQREKFSGILLYFFPHYP